jgi:beta-lactamase class A
MRSSNSNPVKVLAALRQFSSIVVVWFSLFALAPAGAPHAQSKSEVARAQIERLIRESGAEVSVAAEPLDGNGPKFSLFLDADKSFHAASTMKIPVMIELFAQAKAGKLRLDDPLPVRNEFHSLADGSLFQLEASSDSDAYAYKAIGGTMTLRELCEHMITRSSNLATNLLIEKLGVANIQAAVKQLHAGGMQVLRGVEDGKAFAAGMNNTTTARGLFVLLQAIVRGEAVDRGSSDEMIVILKRQQFHEAIPAGLPPGTPIAHKTGEITKIHHDAAIVYTKRPFILVILVRGIADRDVSSKLMAQITRVVHQAIE